MPKIKQTGQTGLSGPALMLLFWGAFTLAALTGCENYRTDRLIGDLSAKEAEVRLSAAIDLGKSKDSRVAPPLIAALRDKDKYVPLRAEESLVTLGPAAVEHLLAALGNREEPNRPVIARILGAIRDVRSIAPLEQALGDPDPALANQARDALLKVLTAALKDSRTEVRLNAVRRLQQLPDPTAIEPLIGALKDPDGNVRQRAGSALGKIGPPAVGSLVGLLADPDPELRRTAAEQLGQIGHPAGVNPLLAALRDPDDDVRWWSAWALGRMGAPAEKALQRLLHDPDPQVRHWATEALNKSKGIPFDPAPR